MAVAEADSQDYTGENNSNEWNDTAQELPVGAAESYVAENRKNRGEKKKKRKTFSRPSVGTTKQDRYLNEELLPEVDEIMHEVVDHRLHTVQEIDEMERGIYRLKIQRYVSAPVEKKELVDMTARVKEAKKAVMSSESRKKLDDALKESERFLQLSRKKESATIQEGSILKRIFF